MYWLVVVVAGLLETGWAVGLKASEGLTRPWISLWTLIAVVASMGLLALALKHLPVSSAYVAWVGIGAVGTVVVGAIWLDEPLTPIRVGSAFLVLVGVVGLTRS